jgi:hypothetical protein
LYTGNFADAEGHFQKALDLGRDRSCLFCTAGIPKIDRFR